jgi:hypothetical protein
LRRAVSFARATPETQGKFPLIFPLLRACFPLAIYCTLSGPWGSVNFPHGPNLQHEGDNMQQANLDNIIFRPLAHISRSPSPIELLWKRHEAAASEKARIYALAEVAATAGSGAVTDAAFDMAEAAADAAYSALEDIADEILTAEATSITDFAIKARVLATRGVEGVGFYRPEDVIQFSPTSRPSPRRKSTFRPMPPVA